MLARLLSVSLLLFAIVCSADEDVIDCGGFVRPTKELASVMTELNQKIDYSKDIRVHLLTVEGKKKFSGECAPNGYYIIPVYDKGTFLIQIEGPDGWSFRPQQVSVNVGSTSSCNQDFELTGFSVSGNVTGAPDCPSSGKAPKKAPKGVKLTLSSANGKRETQTVTSSADGSYVFPNVFPDKYILEASHDTWTIPTKKVDIEKQFGLIKVSKNILVSGYDISGLVLETSETGNAVKGVSFLLYGDQGQSILDCPKQATVFPSDRKSAPLCSVLSQASGNFGFSNIPCGKYTLVPYYKSSSTNYDVVPKELKLTVDQDSLKLSAPFLVKGFSVRGRVVGSSGDGIDGVVVKAVAANSDTRQTVTDQNGEYVLDQITSGTYTLQAFKPHYVFASIKDHKISPNEAELPELVARRYHVCGKISIPQPPAGVGVDNRKVTMKNNEKPKDPLLVARTDNTGAFCFEALSGQYTITPDIPQAEIDAGLLLTDGEIEVSVESGPVLEINFEQARETVAGKILCIESPCDAAISVTISAIGRNFRETTSLAIGHDDSGGEYFVFKGILPGKYEVTINHENWCWQKENELIEVTTKYQSDIKFVQTGYVFIAKSTNDVDLFYREDGKGKEDETSFRLKQGTNTLCLKKPGVYHFTPRSCYKFEQDSYKFDISQNHVLKLNVKQYSVSGTLRVLGLKKGEDPKIEIHVQGADQQETVLPVTISSQKGNETIYAFTYWAELGAHLTITPRSAALFFYPSSISAVVEKNECFPALSVIQGRPGMYLAGSITPPFANIFIKVLYSHNHQPAMEPVLTDKNGQFRAGPLYDDKEYIIQAEKEGYIIKEIEGKPGHFLAQKLGSVEVIVTTSDGAPVSGVLLSLSGAEGYKNNNSTDTQGKFYFKSLYPGQYYLRPLLKEYVFTPSSNSITINEGDDLTSQLIAKRTSYSVFGKVSSLNGEPEKGVSVDATSPDLFEETQTDHTGSFRLRGLIPNKTYKLRVKQGKGKLGIARAQPSEVDISVGTGDIEGINFIVFRPIEKYEITGVVHASENHIQSLSAVLLDITGQQQISTVQLGPNNFFSFDGLDGEKEYIVKLKSTLSERQYSYNLPETKTGALSKADGGTHFINFTFAAEVAVEKVTETEPGSFATLLIAILIGVALYFYNQIYEFVQVHILKKSQNNVKVDNDWASDAIRLKPKKKTQ